VTFPYFIQRSCWFQFVRVALVQGLGLLPARPANGCLRKGFKCSTVTWFFPIVAAFVSRAIICGLECPRKRATRVQAIGDDQRR